MNDDNKRHVWTEADDMQLSEAVLLLQKDFPKRVKFWSAVAGRLLPAIQVSADACRLRWTDNVRRAEVAGADKNKARTDAVAKVESFETDQMDYILEAICGLRDEQRRLGDEVARMRKLWE